MPLIPTNPKFENELYGRLYRCDLFDVEQKLYSGEQLTEEDRTKLLRVLETVYPSKGTR